MLTSRSCGAVRDLGAYQGMSDSDISMLLQAAKDGSTEAQNALFERLHEQLRITAQGLMKNERIDHTLQATALINEACLRLLNEGVVDSAENRRQLFHAAIRAMKQVLVDHARARAAKKRGGSLQRQSLDIVLDQFESTHELSFLDLEISLERLQRESPREHEALTLRFFGGLTIAETARLTGSSESTVEADWRLARAKLMTWLKQG